MKINWFMVIAHVINFLVLGWLLKRFLCKQIREASHALEKRIASQLQEAADKQTAAEAKRTELAQKMSELEATNAGLLIEAARGRNRGASAM